MELEGLKAPFPKGRINWRSQSVSTKDGKSSALALAYVDARDVSDRLDEVCGAANWQCRYSFSPDCKKTLCEIGIRLDGEWVWKADGAGDSDIESEKGSLSDAFKRAGVKWGIARYLYELKSPWVPCEVGQNGKWRKFNGDPWAYVKDGGASEPEPDTKQSGPPLASWEKRCFAKVEQLFGSATGEKAFVVAATVLARKVPSFDGWGENHWRGYLDRLDKLTPEQIEDVKHELADPFLDEGETKTAPAQSLGL